MFCDTAREAGQSTADWSRVTGHLGSSLHIPGNLVSQEFGPMAGKLSESYL